MELLIGVLIGIPVGAVFHYAVSKWFAKKGVTLPEPGAEKAP